MSALAFAAYALAAAALVFARLSPEAAATLRNIQPLLVTFGLVNGVVALAINPWRADRLPEQFPTIVQDALVIGLFAVAAFFILQDRVFATAAAATVVVGFALQDTLGNLFAGLAIQIEKPFRVGHWVTIAGRDGIVREITWRATKISTKAGNLVIVPNNMLSRDLIINYSEPSPETRIEIDVGASYDTPPNEVKATILAAIADEPLLAPGRPPEVLIADFGASAIVYRVRVWTTQFARDTWLADSVRSRIYYAFRRRSITIPYPIQVEIQRPERPAPPRDLAPALSALAAVDIFAPLTDVQRVEMARAARPCVYAAGENVVREGEPGASMFIVVAGELVVKVSGAEGEVARLGAGAFFGEMSLLTGAPRSATVTSVTDCDLLEIAADDIRRLVFTDPSIVEQVATAVTTRQAALDRHRAVAGSPTSGEQAQSLVTRVWKFFRPSEKR